MVVLWERPRVLGADVFNFRSGSQKAVVEIFAVAVVVRAAGTIGYAVSER
jgi:hypothetical protein